MKQTVLSRWVDAALGQDRRQSARAKQALAALGLYVAMSAVMGCGVALGLVDLKQAAWLCAFAVLGGAVFYALIRSGLNLHLTADPSLTLSQSLFCIVAASGAYVVAGPVRGAMLMGMLVVLMLGLSVLTRRQSRHLGVLAVALLGLTMGWCAYQYPAQFAPREELMHFLLAALLMPLTGWLASRLGAIRESLRQHRLQLDEVMSQNRLLVAQDELTSLSNRRHMMSLMVTERARQQRNRQPISIMLLDIDFFQVINDNWGQRSGDQVLQIFADAITHSLRAGDALARWGGEEFLVMLPETPADSALLCVERIRKQLAARSFEHIAPGLKLTFSAGISECTVGDRMEESIERAELAMHNAKTQGRNRSALA